MHFRGSDNGNLSHQTYSSYSNLVAAEELRMTELIGVLRIKKQIFLLLNLILKPWPWACACGNASANARKLESASMF